MSKQVTTHQTMTQNILLKKSFINSEINVYLCKRGSDYNQSCSRKEEKMVHIKIKVDNKVAEYFRQLDTVR